MLSAHVEDLGKRSPPVHMPADAGAAAAEPLERARRFAHIFVHLPRAAKDTAVGIAQKAAHVAERIAEEHADLVRKFALHAALQLFQRFLRRVVCISEPRKERPDVRRKQILFQPLFMADIHEQPLLILAQEYERKPLSRKAAGERLNDILLPFPQTDKAGNFQPRKRNAAMTADGIFRCAHFAPFGSLLRTQYQKISAGVAGPSRFAYANLLVLYTEGRRLSTLPHKFFKTAFALRRRVCHTARDGGGYPTGTPSA